MIKESAKPSRLLSFSNEAIFSAGHNEIIASLIQSLDNYGNNFEKMVEDAVKTTQAAIDLDTAAKAIIPSYTQKIGGKVQVKTLKRSV